MKKQYKKLIVSILTLAMVFTLTGCGGKSSPESTIDSLFASAKDLDYETIETLIDDGAKDGIEEDLDGVKNSFLDESMEDIDYSDIDGYDEVQVNLKDIQSDLTYNIINSEELDDSATVTVEVEYVNGQVLVIDTIRALFSDMMTQSLIGGEELDGEDAVELHKDSVATLAGVFNKSYEGFEKELVKDVVEINLIKNEDGEWLISSSGKELLNALTFDSLNALDTLFSDMFGGFEIEDFETND